MIEDKLQHLQTIRLPEEVRIRMRADLIAYAELHAPLQAVETSAPVRASLANIFALRLYSGLAIAALLIVGAGGTAFAAENTLPGDFLYPVKVGVVEPVQTALVPSERGKASWNAMLAERRLEEAAQLAAEDKLTPNAQTELAANFAEHVEASEKHAARLVRTGDANGSLSVQSDLEARLTAHEQILTVIATHYDLSTSTTQNGAETKVALAQLLSTVRDHQSAIVSARLALEDSIAPALASTAKVATMSVSASSTPPEIAIERVIHLRHAVTPAARIASADAARTEEVTNILDRHATLLAKFLPVATTTASTTATTTVNVATPTASTTSVGKVKNSEDSDAKIVNP